MADLYIDGVALDRLRADLANIRELLEGPARDLAGLDDQCVGADDLRARTAEFAEEWAYGIAQLAKFAGDAAHALDQIGRAFADADTALTRALRGGEAR